MEGERGEGEKRNATIYLGRERAQMIHEKEKKGHNMAKRRVAAKTHTFLIHFIKIYMRFLSGRDENTHSHKIENKIATTLLNDRPSTPTAASTIPDPIQRIAMPQLRPPPPPIYASPQLLLIAEIKNPLTLTLSRTVT